MHLRSYIQRLQLVFAVLALLLAQSLTFAHQLEHSGPLPDHECALCVAGLHLNLAMPGATMPPLPTWPDIEAPLSLLPVHTQLPLAPLQRARAPPMYL